MGSGPDKVKSIRNSKGRQEYVASAKRAKKHLLNSLSEKEPKAFSRGLVLDKCGIAGMEVTVLQKKLPCFQHKDLLAHFGMNIVFADGREGNYCAARGDCRPSTTRICTSNRDGSKNLKGWRHVPVSARFPCLVGPA